MRSNLVDRLSAIPRREEATTDHASLDQIVFLRRADEAVKQPGVACQSVQLRQDLIV